MYRMVSALVLALMLSLSSMAAAGDGANCDKSHAKATHAGNKSHAGHAGNGKNAKVDLQAKARHGWLGLEVGKNASGTPVVTGIEPGSPAEKAGFIKGDVLVAFNGIAITSSNMDALKKAKAQNAVGRRVTYTIARAGAERQIAATLAEVPKEVLARWEKEYHKPLAVAQTDN